MKERQPSHKRHVIPIAISIIGCLSILLLPQSFAQVTNPSTGDTVGTYCASGVCHTPGAVINPVRPNVTIAIPVNNTVGTVKLTQSCIGDTCNKITTLHQLGKIGIQLSQVCLSELKSHLNSTDCLNYNDLKQFDNTNPLWAGLWVEVPYEHRLPPKIKNHENFNPNPWAIMVDPNADYTTSAKMIIVDTHFTWTNQNDSSNMGLQMKSYQDRYVSPDCNEARVGPSLPLTEDTITYLESGCVTTNMNTTKITTQKEIPFSYNNQYSTLHLQSYLQSILHGHSSTNTNKTAGGLGPQDCIRHTCSFKDPYAKAGW